MQLGRKPSANASGKKATLGVEPRWGDSLREVSELESRLVDQQGKCKQIGKKTKQTKKTTSWLHNV